MSGDRLDLDAIEARALEATPSPWRAMPNLGGVPNGVDLSIDPCVFAVVHSDASPHNLAADTAFIAHAREDVPALVAEVRRLQELVGEDDGGLRAHAKRDAARLERDMPW